MHMSYLKGETWTLTPVSPYKIIRNCPKCGTRSLFQSTGNFRINANKKCVDIWLIYQCEKCRSTYNLTIFERVSPKKLPEGSYKKFQENNSALALEIGTSKEIFEKNRAVVKEGSISCIVTKENTEIPVSLQDSEGNSRIIHIQNPNGLKIRADKFLAEQLSISRSKVKHLIADGLLLGSKREDLEKIHLGSSLLILLKTTV